MDNFEFRKFSDSLDRIATAMEHCEVFIRWYTDTLSKMGIDDQRVIDFVRQSIDDGIKQMEEDHKSYYEVLAENEALKREIRSLNEQLESAYADISEHINDDEEDD